MDQNVNPEKEAQAAVDQVMPQQKKPGRKALQIFAVVVLLALVAGGVYAWQNSRVATLENEVAELKKEPAVEKETVTADPYAGWKTYTTQYEKLTFKAPANYVVSNTSEKDGKNIVTPGSDSVTIKTPTGMMLTAIVGIDGIGGFCENCKVVKTEPITFLGSSAYLNYATNSYENVQILVAPNSKIAYLAGFDSKNITSTAGTKDPATNMFTINYGDNDKSNTIKISKYEADTELANMKLVVKSFTY